MKDDKESKAIIPYKKPEISEDIEKLLRQTEELTKEDFYKVGKKVIPSARALQFDANRKRISTKVIDWGSDEKRAWAHVAGWIGKEDSPLEYKEAIVEIVYETELASYILNKATSSNWKIKRDEITGVPRPESNMHWAMARDYLLRKRQFGIREALTKAEAIINKKLLSMEFREREEIEFEKDEIEAVKQQQRLQRGQQPIKPNPIPSTKNGKQNQHSGKLHDIRREAQPQLYGTDNNNGTVFEHLDTLTLKRDSLVKIIRHEDNPLHKQLKRLLNGRNILNLTEKEIDGIIGIFLIEAKKEK